MDAPTEEQLAEMIIDLQEQLKFCNDDTISDELIKEIKYRENQQIELIINNNAL